MTLTVYCAHALVLNSGLLEDNDLALWLVLVAGALVFAVLWNRWMGQGPLERLVAIGANRARRAVLDRPPQGQGGPSGDAEPSETTKGTGAAP
jgi:uncharacterized membrane protein YeiB